MTSPFLPVARLADDAFIHVRRRAIFDCCKWDPQVADACVVARYPLVLKRLAWDEIAALAERLTHEVLDAEAELLARPALHARLGLPRGIRRALRGAVDLGSTPGMARIMRFDFHHTPDGWRISEVNADVPGGLNEASGFPRIVGPMYGFDAVGDPARAYAEALFASLAPGGQVALTHATAYSDDLQMMRFVGDELRTLGIEALPASPAQLRWTNGRARLGAAGRPLDGIVRFFPAEWLDGLPQASGWSRLFAGGLTPVSNPPSALLVQTKRFPLVWSMLEVRLPTWRQLLPETREPADAPWRNSDDWVIKPALGRVGEGVGMRDLTAPSEWRKISRSVFWHPLSWVAQRRFSATAAEVDGTPVYPCIGVYTVDGRVAGAYGRASARPLIDSHAEDAAVLVAA